MSWQSDAGLPENFTLPGMPYNDPAAADPSKGTMVRMPDGSFRHFDPVQDANGNYISPKTFIGDEYDGGYAAAMPGTPEYDHYENLHQRSNNQGVLKVGALVGGAALAGALAGAGAGSGAASTLPYSGSSIAGGAGGAALPAGGGVLAPAAAGTNFAAAAAPSALPAGGGVMASDASADAVGATSAGGGGGGSSFFSKFGKFLRMPSFGGGGRSSGPQMMPYVNRMPQQTGFLPVNRPKSKQDLLIEEMSRGNA